MGKPVFLLIIIMLALSFFPASSYATELSKKYTGEVAGARARFIATDTATGKLETLVLYSNSIHKGTNNTSFELHPDGYISQGVENLDDGNTQIYAHLDHGDIFIGALNLLVGTDKTMGNVHVFLKFFTGDSDYDPITGEYSGTGKVYYLHGTAVVRITSDNDVYRKLMSFTEISAHQTVVYSIQDGVLVDAAPSLATSVRIKPIHLESVPLQ